MICNKPATHQAEEFGPLCAEHASLVKPHAPVSILSGNNEGRAADFACGYDDAETQTITSAEVGSLSDILPELN